MPVAFADVRSWGGRPENILLDLSLNGSGPEADSDGVGLQPGGCEIAGIPADWSSRIRYRAVCGPGTWGIASFREGDIPP